MNFVEIIIGRNGGIEVNKFRVQQALYENKLEPIKISKEKGKRKEVI